MKNFIQYLDEIEALKKLKKFDEVWRVANKGIIDLLSQKDDSWSMMYYQMADIAARQKKWLDALFQMGLVIYYLKRIGGITHERFVRRLLKKFGKEILFNDFIELSIKTNPRELGSKIKKLLE